MTDAITKLALLLFTHALADFPLQGDYLARAKSHREPLPGTPWPVALCAHSVIHGGFVGVITGSLLLGLLEMVSHVAIDYAKSDGRITYGQDQALHIACKAIWISLLCGGVR